MSCVDPILPHHNPNEGRDIINSNFETLCELAFSGITASTIVSGSSNIDSVQTGSLPSEYTIYLKSGITVNSVVANIFSGGTGTFSSVSATTFYSGSTDLSTLFQLAGAEDITRVQSGLNTYTGGTVNFPSVNVSALTIDNIIVSGSSRFNSLSATTLSGGTIYSGSTDLSLLFAPIGTIGSGIRNNIVSGVSVTVVQDFQYLVYGNLTIYSGGSLTNNGEVVIINGALSLSGGTFTNNASLLMVDLQLDNNKYTANFSTTAGVPLNINHSLSTQDFVYMARQGTSEISLQMTIVDDNNVTITTTSSVSGRIIIIGVN